MIFFDSGQVQHEFKRLAMEQNYMISDKAQ